MKTNNPSPDSSRSASHVHQNTFRAAHEFRWAFYLHLDTAKKTERKWHDHKFVAHPVFEVEGKRRLVFVRGYFENQGHGDKRRCLIHKVTTKGTLPNGKIKPNLVRLDVVIPGDTQKTFIQTISEYYPMHLIEADGNEPPHKLDPHQAMLICKILDHRTYQAPSLGDKA